MDMRDCDHIITQVARVLKVGGRLVASIPHPCFGISSNSGWLVEKQAFEAPLVFRKVRAYRKLSEEKVPWRLPNGKRMYTVAFHRTLNWYAKALAGSGLATTALEEPEPTKEFIQEEKKKEGDLDAAGFLEVPLHLVFEAVKLS